MLHENWQVITDLESAFVTGLSQTGAKLPCSQEFEPLILQKSLGYGGGT